MCSNCSIINTTIFFIRKRVGQKIQSTPEKGWPYRHIGTIVPMCRIGFPGFLPQKTWGISSFITSNQKHFFAPPRAFQFADWNSIFSEIFDFFGCHFGSIFRYFRWKKWKIRCSNVHSLFGEKIWKFDPNESVTARICSWGVLLCSAKSFSIRQ